MSDVDGASVAANGWRQGSVLPAPLVSLLIAEHQIPGAIVPRSKSYSGWIGRFRTALHHLALRRREAAHIDADTEMWMIISQDCDLLQSDWSKEPYVELLRLRQCESQHLSAPWGQSPRDMQFGDKNTPKFECSIHDCVRVDRKYLADAKPDDSRTIDGEIVRRICRWISRRYVRAAFPDTFNERVKSKLDSLTRRKSPLDSHSELITGVYIRVSEAELGADEDYELIIWAAMRPQDYEDPQKSLKAQELLDLLEAALGECRGVDVLECVCKSEQDITLDHLHTWKRWDFDVLSLRPKKKNGPLPPVNDLPPEL